MWRYKIDLSIPMNNYELDKLNNNPGAVKAVAEAISKELSLFLNEKSDRIKLNGDEELVDKIDGVKDNLDSIANFGGTEDEVNHIMHELYDAADTYRLWIDNPLTKPILVS